MNIRIRGVVACFVFVSLLVSTLGLLMSPAHAHGTGVSIERVMGEYLIDIGYSPDPLRVGENSVFDFTLRKSGDNAEVPFTHVWVRLENGDGILLAVGLKKADFGKTSLLYSFPSEGEYQMIARFQNNDKTITEVSVPVAILPSASETPKSALYSGILQGITIFAGGALCGFVFSHFRRTKHMTNPQTGATDSS